MLDRLMSTVCDQPMRQLVPIEDAGQGVAATET
jgi:hypothetical protein